MDQFPSNSIDPNSRINPKKEPEEKRILKVVNGDIVRKKQTIGSRFREVFGGGDSGRNILDYVVFEVLAPSAKEMIEDAIKQAVERMLYGGDSRSSNRRSGPRPARTNHVNYSSYSSPSRREEPRRMSRRGRANHDFDEIVLATRYEAEQVIDQLTEIIEGYDEVTVKDLYEMIGENFSPVDEKWGWRELPNAGVRRLRGGNGYLLDIPKPVPLD